MELLNILVKRMEPLMKPFMKSEIDTAEAASTVNQIPTALLADARERHL